jgi:conjugal transfer mating pair stabilization protein TraG
MEYVIYTYGGSDLLISVFDAIAKIFESDNKYLTPVGTMALILGGVYAGIKATFRGDIATIGKHWMIPSIIAFLILFSPKTTVWIRDEVTLSAPVKKDNIPFGISFFTSIGSTISHHLSVLIEETMPPVDAGRPTTGGIFYGAKAVAKIRDIQIQDPILLKNTKEYLRQCYMLPYIIGNFGGKKSAAQKAENLLKFLNANPAKRLGIKPTNKDGSVANFMTCTEAGKMLETDIEAESKSPLLMKQFAATLGIRTEDEAIMKKRIKSMTGDVFRYLEQGHDDINEWMQQAMMLNANRESYDDWREKYGHPRVYPELVKMQATRGLFQQSMGSIIGAEMSESMIPAASQPTMLALVVMLFVIILPFAMLPGGWVFIVTGVKLMIWVCTWPVFYSIIHALAMIQLKDSVGAWGHSGLSLAGQAGFTELIMMKYAAVQSLVTATPLISFAIVFGSPYALSTIAAGIASVSAAIPLGSSMADGSLQMRQKSYDNTTTGQHNIAPTLTMGSNVVDGAISSKIGQDGQSMILTEHGSQLINNHNGAEGVVASANESLTSAQSDMAALTRRQSENATTSSAKTADLARSFASGTATSDLISVSEAESLKDIFGKNETLAKGTTIGDTQSTGTSSDIGIGVPSAFSTFTGISGGTRVNAGNTHDIRSDQSQQDRRTYDKIMDKVQTAAKTGNFSTSNSEDTRLAESLKSDLIEQEQISKDMAKTQQAIDTYSNQLSYATTNSGTINRNLNEPFLREVMARHPELASPEHARRWAANHKEEADIIGQEVIRANNPFDTDHYKAWVANINNNTPSVQDTTIASTDSLESKYRENAANINKQAVVKDAAGVAKSIKEVVADKAASGNLEYSQDVGETLRNNLSAEQQEIMTDLENEEVRGEETKTEEIETALAEVQNKPISSKSTIYRALEEAGYNAGLSDRAIQPKNIIVPGYKNKDKKEE